MGKDSSEKKIKKEKKEKKEKRAETEGVVKPKKDKKDKKTKIDSGLLEAELAKSPEESLVNVIKDAVKDVIMGEDEDEKPSVKTIGALVPFAHPLIEEPKDVKKILRAVKKSAKTKTLRRGVKEVVKALRKSTIMGPASSNASDPPAIAIIAADISPMDVISHIPVLCEDHSIPYLYVRSRAELGEASATKRPTSVVMVSKERVSKKAKEAKGEDVKEFEEAFKDLLKVALKAGKSVRK